MSKQVFRPGAPPHVGWWYTKGKLGTRAWRWFDGKCWSIACYSCESAEAAASWGSCCMWDADAFVWSRYWPKNARVPRVAP